jgi:hypothetical protein
MREVDVASGQRRLRQRLQAQEDPPRADVDAQVSVGVAAAHRDREGRHLGRSGQRPDRHRRTQCAQEKPPPWSLTASEAARRPSFCSMPGILSAPTDNSARLGL